VPRVLRTWSRTHLDAPRQGCDQNRSFHAGHARPSIVTSLLCLSVACGVDEPVSDTDRPAITPRQGPPNIVIVFVDDMGYGDLSSASSPTIRTPNIDAIAAAGVTF